MKTFKSGTKLGNVITEKEIESWKSNIYFDCPTGSGKTYFVENNLYNYVKKNNGKIIYLCNRKALKDEVLNRITLANKQDVFSVTTYQSIQNELRKKQGQIIKQMDKKDTDEEDIKVAHDMIENVEKYSFVICDECDYFTRDGWNLYTDLSYRYINEYNALKIFMSATGDTIFVKLKKDRYLTDNHYYISRDYNYANLLFYYLKDQSYSIINGILNTTEDKIIYFNNSLTDAMNTYYNLISIYGEDIACFRCSKYTTNTDAIKLNEEYKDCICESSFKQRILITTKALDCGINIKDKQVKHLIYDIPSIESTIQCLGRKRILDSDDNCTFYICDYGKRALRNYKGNMGKDLKPIETYISDYDEFVRKYESDRKFKNNYIFSIDGKLTFNELGYIGLKKDYDDICLAQEIKHSGWATLIELKLTNIRSVTFMEEIDNMSKKDAIRLYLEAHIGERLFKERQKELIEVVSLKDSRGLIQKGINTLNQYCIDNYDMTITSKRIKKNSKLHTVWIISKLN